MSNGLRPDLALIADWVAPGSQVLDLGCGDGALLAYLQAAKGCRGYGVEINDAQVLACLRAGVDVIQQDIEAGLGMFHAPSFDVVVLSMAIQMTHQTERVLRALSAAAVIGLPAAHAAAAASPPRVTEIARGLAHPWSLAFLPDGRMLVTERPGRLRIIGRDGRASAPLAGVPAVFARGQGGLLDLVPGPGFARDGSLFLSFSEPADAGARTAVARAELVDGPTPALRGTRTIFAQRSAVSGGNHFGSRLVFARDGTLFVTLGDRFTQRDRAQALDNHFGKIVRIAADGSVPRDNPFVGRPDALPGIHSYGHRNVQGAALHPVTGQP